MQDYAQQQTYLRNLVAPDLILMVWVGRQNVLSQSLRQRAQEAAREHVGKRTWPMRNSTPLSFLVASELLLGHNQNSLCEAVQNRTKATLPAIRAGDQTLPALQRPSAFSAPPSLPGSAGSSSAGGGTSSAPRCSDSSLPIAPSAPMTSSGPEITDPPAPADVVLSGPGGFASS